MLVSALLVIGAEGQVDAQVSAPLTPLQPRHPCTVSRPSHDGHVAQQLRPIPVVRVPLRHVPTVFAEMHSGETFGAAVQFLFSLAISFLLSV